MGGNSSVPITNIQVKVKLMINGRQEEIRCFQVRDLKEMEENYYDIYIGKLYQIFPQLPTPYSEIKLTWTDKDNDVIRISNNADLLIAVQRMPEIKVFQVHMKKVEKKAIEFKAIDENRKYIRGEDGTLLDITNGTPLKDDSQKLLLFMALGLFLGIVAYFILKQNDHTHLQNYEQHNSGYSN